jgi:hypothetical protein
MNELQEQYKNDGKVKIFQNPAQVLIFLNEHYKDINPILDFGLVSPTDEPIKPKYNLIDMFFSSISNSINAKPIDEVLKTGFDDWDDASFIIPEIKGIHDKFNLSELDKFYSNFNSKQVDKRIKQLNGALPALAVYKSEFVENGNIIPSFKISYDNHPKALDYLLVMDVK